MDKQNDRKLLSAREICAELEISRETLRRRVRGGKFPEPVLNEDGRLYWDASALPPAAAPEKDVTAEPVPIVAQELDRARIDAARDEVSESIGGGN